jgi:hypothetical protein
MIKNAAFKQNIQRPLIDIYRKREINNLSKFAAEISILRQSNLRSKYQIEVENAPDRNSVGKKYIVGHDGIPSTGGYTNRNEEHLAIAIFNFYNPRQSDKELFLCIDEGLKVIDYQLPLKARRNDKGVGKIDLFCIDKENQACVVELKFANKGNPDTPLRGLLEGLAYSAIVQANFESIYVEVLELFNIAINIEIPPKVILMAPSNYWNFFRNKKSAGDWENQIMELTQYVTQEVEIKISFVELLNVEFEHGLFGKRPKLKTHLICKPAL